MTLILFLLLAQAPAPEQAVRHVLETQQAAWNRGDVDAFMAGYEASDATTFVGSAITRGYQPVLGKLSQALPDQR